jgi:hypothetical protein
LDILSKFGQGRKNIVENKKEHFIKEVRKSEKGREREREREREMFTWMFRT